MSEIKYGLISRVDASCIEATLDLIFQQFPEDEFIYVTEIGVFDGQTARGMRDYLLQNRKTICYTGIDAEKDKLVGKPFDTATLIRGRSDEVYNQIPDNSQHFIFVDALHTFPAVISDFYCYAPKVKPGCYLCFHDTGKHLDSLSGWQGVGDKNDPDMCLGGVRKALYELGLIILDGDKQWMGEYGQHFQWATGNRNECWELIFDEADPEDTGGGVTIFKKLY